ncbi:conserved hypothetical protein [Leishmania major strain Friedlin]|uniref:Uncharacterized protein n=1 Tax=Leishmania major TaxID=5664 RepID=Q4QHZ6_LEIMA|nr:conserved hypothetical protein [Leishmania major strain Friedlin]CAG9569634.1 hypothetical_protein_-__conserved [Leishmania major strain Friedlin]CAJ02425.1 conserved hypothetical protein [Leishmania major strain Friedlin]|eukprot:XP_001681202.1 conserved hypothetical protein [Leishmania major strain Friedlin]
MTLVFEARRLPFGSISEVYAASIQPIVALHALDKLPLWDRCMLVAVLPVVQQRHSASAAAAPPSTVVRPSLTRNDSDNADAAAASLSSATVRAANHEERVNASPELAGAPSLEDVALALTIVRALDELEVVYDSSISTRAELEQQQQQQPSLPAASLAEAPRRAFKQPKKTSEELLMEQLLQERFTDTAPYLLESSDEGGENSADAAVDVAMCFTVKGESLGIGSATIFGGHGYHP